MAQRFIEPIARIFTNAGAVGVGYKYYFYQTNTTTPVTTYQDDGLTVQNTNPALSDANGRFPEIWYSDLSQLKLVVKDSSDNTLETVDPVGASSSAVSLNDFDVRPTSYWGLTAGTSTVYTLVANPTISAYANTQTFVVQPHVDCGNSPTLAIDGLSALNWKKYTQQGTKVALKANDLRASQRYFCINDGVDIVCLNPSFSPLLLGSATALTIATGAVTLTNNSSSYVIDTEASASTDDLDTISGGQEGQIIILNTANNSRDITLRTGIGNIINPSGLNVVLYNTNDAVVLRYNGTNWIVVCFNNSNSEPVNFLEVQTASSSPTLPFTNLSSSYRVIEFEFINILPATDGKGFRCQVSTDNGSSYVAANYLGLIEYLYTGGALTLNNLATTHIDFCANYNADTNFGMENSSSKGLCGTLKIYLPSSSSTNKHIKFDVDYTGFFAQALMISRGSVICNDSTTAINAIKFYFDSGNIASGSIVMRGYR